MLTGARGKSKPKHPLLSLQPLEFALRPFCRIVSWRADYFHWIFGASRRLTLSFPVNRCRRNCGRKKRESCCFSGTTTACEHLKIDSWHKDAAGLTLSVCRLFFNLISQGYLHIPLSSGKGGKRRRLLSHLHFPQLGPLLHDFNAFRVARSSSPNWLASLKISVVTSGALHLQRNICSGTQGYLLACI